MFITLKLLHMKRKMREISIYHPNNRHERSSSPPTRHSNLLPSTSLIFLKAPFICCPTSLSCYSYTHTHTHTHTHIHKYTRLPSIRLLLKWLLMCELEFEICRYRKRVGLDHFKHKPAFPEQNTKKPVPTRVHVCVCVCVCVCVRVFPINIHTASDQLISTDHVLMVGLIPIFLLLFLFRFFGHLRN